MATNVLQPSAAPGPRRRLFLRLPARAFGALRNNRGTLALADQGIVSATNFATNALVARYCLPREFGVYFLALSLLYFLRGIQEQLVSAPYTIYAQRRTASDLATYSGSTQAHQLLISVALLTVVAVVGAVVELVVGPCELVNALRVLLAVTPCFLLREHIRKLMFANFQFWVSISVDALVAFTQLAGLVLLLRLERLNAASVYLSIAVASGGASLYWWTFHRLSFRFHTARIWADWRENWSFGRWALVTHLIGCSTPYVMPWFIASLRGEVVTAMYGACMTLVGVANMVLTGVSNFLSPRTAHAYAHGGIRPLWRVLMKATVLFVLTVGPFCVVLSLVGTWLPAFLFSASYTGLGPTLLLLGLALLANCLGMTAGNGLWAMDRPSLNLSADLLSLVVTFSLGWMLIPHMDQTGAALAVLVGAVLAAVTRWWILVWLMRCTVRRATADRSIS